MKGFIGPVSLVGMIVMGLIWAGEAPLATPSSGITQTQVAAGVFAPFHVKRKTDDWEADFKIKGMLTMINYQSSIAIPGATTGWHSHPGPLFITVTAGTVTVYNAEDPTCTPRVFTAGQGFVEPETVHVLRNEGSIDARWTSANIRAVGQPTRIDAPDPGICPF